MDKLIRLSMLLSLFIAVNVQADIRFNNRTYIACDTCTTDLQYMAAAESHHMRIFGVNAINARDMDVYVVLNENSGQLKTVLLRRIYETLFVRFPGAQSRILSHITAQILNNSSSDLAFLNSYNAFEFTQVLPSSFASKPNWFSLGKLSGRWLDEGDFISNNRSQINSMVASSPINPFLFAASPMKFYVITSDGYKVAIVSPDMFEDYNWVVAFASRVSSEQREYFDNSGNLISNSGISQVPSNAECFVSMFLDICREKSNYFFYGQVYTGDRFSAFTGCEPNSGSGKVCPIRPPECLPGSQTCPRGE